jgi:hypothetical protein
MSSVVGFLHSLSNFGCAGICAGIWRSGQLAWVWNVLAHELVVEVGPPGRKLESSGDERTGMVWKWRESVGCARQERGEHATVARAPRNRDSGPTELLPSTWTPAAGQGKVRHPGLRCVKEWHSAHGLIRFGSTSAPGSLSLPASSFATSRWNSSVGGCRALCNQVALLKCCPGGRASLANSTQFHEHGIALVLVPRLPSQDLVDPVQDLQGAAAIQLGRHGRNPKYLDSSNI